MRNKMVYMLIRAMAGRRSFSLIRVMLPDKADKVLLSQRAGEEEALHIVAVVFPEHLLHFLCFHALDHGSFTDTLDRTEGGFEDGHGGRFRHGFPDRFIISVFGRHDIPGDA